MEWKNLIVPIQESGISGDVSYKILLDLFEYAGSTNYVSEAAAKSWLNGSRNCKASTYFPAGKADTESLFRYFRNRPDGKLRRLQQIFKDKKRLDDDSPIDLNTDNLDVFCRSLVNQFLDLLGFQRIDIPHTTASSADMPSKAGQQQGTGMSTDTASSESAGSISPGDFSSSGKADILNAESSFIQSMLWPHKERCCFYCKHWTGNTKTVGAYRMPTYAACRIYSNKTELCSTTVACKDYESNSILLFQLELQGIDIKDLI